MVCLRLCLLLGVLLAFGSMHHNSPSKQDNAGHIIPFVASVTPASKSDSFTFPGHAHVHENEHIGNQKSSNFAGFNIDKGLRYAQRGTGDFQQNFSWDALIHPPGSASESALFEDGAEACIQHSVKSGKKRPRSDQDNKETASPKYYECRFCPMKFDKSQALGGHMNRHKQGMCF